jgi:hypothetical protein
MKSTTGKSTLMDNQRCNKENQDINMGYANESISKNVSPNRISLDLQCQISPEINKSITDSEMLMT